MTQNKQAPLLLTTAYIPRVGGSDRLDIIFQRFTTSTHFNEFTTRAILEDLTSNPRTADRNLLCQFIIDMIQEDQLNSDELSSANYHLLYTFVDVDLLDPDMDANMRNQIPFIMRYQINNLLRRYRDQAAVLREDFVERYLNTNPAHTKLDARAFRTEFPIVIWLNEEMEQDRRVDTPQRCLRRAYCYRKLTSILWTLENSFAHVQDFSNPKLFRKLIRESAKLRGLRLDFPFTLRDGTVAYTLDALLDYLVHYGLDRRVQFRVSRLENLEHYRLELLYLGDFNEIKPRYS